jgi:hypothetical protein
MPPWKLSSWMYGGGHSQFTTIRSFSTRTLCVCTPAGIGMCATCFGCFGSLMSRIDVPAGASMWAT